MHPIQISQRQTPILVAPLVGSLLTIAFSFSATLAQADELSSEQRYQLCSSFPYNSQCEDYTAPVALSDRLGEEGHCIQQIASLEQGGKCKFVTSDQGITAYIETGAPLSILDDQRNTMAINVTYDQVQGLEYREFKQNNNATRAVNTFLFGAIGFFATRNKPVSEVIVQYTPGSESDEIATASMERLSLIFDRDKGYSVRTHLESKTELRVSVPADELPVLEEPDVDDDAS